MKPLRDLGAERKLDIRVQSSQGENPLLRAHSRRRTQGDDPRGLVFPRDIAAPVVLGSFSTGTRLFAYRHNDPLRGYVIIVSEPDEYPPRVYNAQRTLCGICVSDGGKSIPPSHATMIRAAYESIEGELSKRSELDRETAKFNRALYDFISHSIGFFSSNNKQATVVALSEKTDYEQARTFFVNQAKTLATITSAQQPTEYKTDAIETRVLGWLIPQSSDDGTFQDQAKDTLCLALRTIAVATGYKEIKGIPTELAMLTSIQGELGELFEPLKGLLNIELSPVDSTKVTAPFDEQISISSPFSSVLQSSPPIDPIQFVFPPNEERSI